jgi:DNA-binding SARP family transcriptional activator/DNA-binding XRE family transcriptional regulator
MSGHRQDGMGSLLRECRVGAGLTQQDLAAAAGVSVGTLRDLEQGRTRHPRWETVNLVAEALGMDRYQRAALASRSSEAPERDGLTPDETRPLPGVQINVLGPLRVVRDAAVITPQSSRLGAVLGLLALHGRAGVPRDVIIDVLWGERPPPSAVAQLQANVSKLRKLLDPRRAPRADGSSLVLTGSQYRLDDRITVDLDELRQLSRHADAAAGRGEFLLASALYERGVALWRGGVLAEIDVLRGHPAVTAASRSWALAVQRLAGIAGSASDGHQRVLPHLRELCSREPFNERACALLMTALAATGQQAQALQLFDEVRRRLDDELGVCPSSVLAAAHLGILRQLPQFMPRPPVRYPGTPDHISPY